MRLVHCGDLHLDLRTHAHLDSETGVPSRILDGGRCWRKVCEIAGARAADLLVVAGDVFHGPNPSAAALNEFESGLRIAQEAEVPVVLIPGNHDRAPHPGQQCVLEVFADPEVQVVTMPRVVSAGGVRVACLPSVSRHQLMARNPGLTRAAADEVVVDALARTLDMLRDPAERADVLIGHWPIAGTVIGAEKDIAIIPEPMLPLAALEGPWKLAAFAHIHKAQVHHAGGDTEFGYSGSIDRISFAEEHDPKVCIEWEIGDGATEFQMHELPARRFVTITESSQENVEGAIVRLKLAPDYAQHVDEIRAAMYAAGADVVIGGARIERTPVRRAERVTEELGVEEALEEWFDLRGIEEGDRADVREATERLREEVEASG